MKEFARDFLMNMSEEARIEFLKSIDPDRVWEMAEGKPHQETDITSGGKPIYIPSELLPKNDLPQSTEPDSE